jgi:DNA-binding transcriptional LysR family regulator
MYDATLLNAFLAIHDEGGITRAAKRLNLTQSAVSAQIRKLEEQLGCILFNRTTRSVRLTVQGEILLGYARDILALQEEAAYRIGRKKQLVGRVRLGCSEGLVAEWLCPLLSRFTTEHPATDLHLHLGITTELREFAERRMIDIVVGAVCEDAADAHDLWSEPLVWAFREGSEPDWTSPLRLAFFPEPCPYRRAAIGALEQAGTSWRLACTSPSIAGVQAAALSGLAITPLTRSCLRSGMRELPPHPSLPGLPDATFAMKAAPGAHGAVVQALMTAIRDLPPPGERASFKPSAQQPA